MEQCLQHEECISQLHESINAVKQDTDKIIIGLYGPLDKPNSGFAVEISRSVDELKTAVLSLSKIVTENIDDRKRLAFHSKTALISAVFSLAIALILFIVKGL